jgi:hypothetical protein
MPAPVIAAAGASGGGASGGASGAAQFGKGGQMLGKQSIGKKDLINQGQQQAPDLDSARGEMKKPDMGGHELGKGLNVDVMSIPKPLKKIAKSRSDIGGMG